MELHGFLNIDKPEDWSSHDVVAKLRRALKPYEVSKIGHAGTLDPFATGVLPIAIGASTRLIRFLPKTKRYMAEVDFSFLTDTDDLTGERLDDVDEEMMHSPAVAQKRDVSHVSAIASPEGAKESPKWSRESLAAKLTTLVGKLEQLPPLYSARKQNGKRLYELMRSEKEIDVEAIKTKVVDIHAINLLSFDYPLAVIDVSCSEGTYIRSIARDLGGHLTKLRRLESNKFKIETARNLEELIAQLEEGADLEAMLTPSAKVLDLPVLEFDNKEVIYLQQGREVSVHGKAELKASEEAYFKCLAEDSELVALGVVASKRGDLVLQPKIVL